MCGTPETPAVIVTIFLENKIFQFDLWGASETHPLLKSIISSGVDTCLVHIKPVKHSLTNTTAFKQTC